MEKKLSKGDLVEFAREFRNFYGIFVTVRKDGIEYDIKQSNLKPSDEKF